MNAERTVAGERSVIRAIAVKSPAIRAQRLLSAALVLAVGVAVLAWYYLHLGDEGRRKSAAGAAGLRTAAASEMRLPMLEPRSPREQPSFAGPGPAGGVASESASPADVAQVAAHADRAATEHPDGSAPSRGPSVHATSPVLIRPPPPSAAEPATAARTEVESVPNVVADRDAQTGHAAWGDTLRPTVTTATQAALLPTRRWLLPKGSFLDCTLETAIDSTFAGLTTCVLATDVYGADGRVVLLERGTKLVGETRSEVRAGQARVSVLWNEARTPTGVTINLASPGTDPLGRAGVPGEVDRHTGERFGAAVLLSVLDGALAAAATRHAGSGAVIYNAQNVQDVATEALRYSIAIPPTIRVDPGARVMVTVVRDVDFRGVYRLAAHAHD